MWARIMRWLKGERLAQPVEVVLYTRQGCHLCHDALTLLRRLAAEFPLTVREVDIDGDAELVSVYGDKVPVIAVGGRPRLWGKFSEVLLRRLLRGESRRAE